MSRLASWISRRRWEFRLHLGWASDAVHWRHPWLYEVNVVRVTVGTFIVRPPVVVIGLVNVEFLPGSSLNSLEYMVPFSVQPELYGLR